MKNRIWNSFLLLLRMILLLLSAVGIVLFLPSLAGFQSYAVLSGSMEPAIHTGSIVYIDSNKRTPEAGDVITYRLGKINVTHRVKNIRENGFYETGGDANELSDAEYVSKEQILGIVCWTIPYLGYLVMYLRTINGMISIGILISLYVCMKSIEKESESERRADWESVENEDEKNE